MDTRKPIIPSFFLILLFYSLQHTQSIYQVHSNLTDQTALYAFKSQITQDPFEILATWNPNTTFCNWKGVNCNSKKERVISLDLESFKLAGTISPFIANLSLLHILNLQNNSFNGFLPQELGSLIRLQNLSLGSNLLHGTIPSSLGSCSRLRLVDLSNNRLEGRIPPQLGLLTELQDLSVAKNFLTGSIPPSFGNLSSLNNLILMTNGLQGSVPDDLGHLRKLTSLQIGDNNITGEVPSSIFNISSLMMISMAKNSLLGSLPSDIFATLPNLDTLFMGGNLLEGPIPLSLTNASKLERLDLSTNGFTGRVPLLGNLPRIQILNLEINQLVGGLDFLTSLANSSLLQVFSVATNQLSGRIPPSVGNLSSQLSLLLLDQNQLEGNIPEEIGNLVNLTLLSLEANSFTGKIPATIGKLQNLQELLLDMNIFSGPIPDTFGNLTALFQLDFNTNNLSGAIPSSLGNCQLLQLLDLSLNGFTGAVPKEIFRFSGLGQVLNLSWNSLTGTLPQEIGELKMVQLIDVSHNLFSGKIPASIGDCSNLQYLSMAGNSFQGPVPDSLGQLKGIEFIDLSSNNLSGTIPSSLNSLKFLQFLNLSMNHLEGEVPEGRLFSNSTAISLSGNPNICGGIPKLKLPNCPTLKNQKHSSSLTVKLVIGLLGGFFVLCFLLGLSLVLHRRQQRTKPLLPTAISFEGPQLYTYYDLRTATNNFSAENLIGEGSFGSVYRGVLSDGTVAAIKVFNMDQHGASKSFIAECEALRNIRHRNLVKILSASSGGDFKALVLQFMSNGSLENWLYEMGDSRTRGFGMVKRLEIAIDVACAMEYLHHDCEIPVVHCDLKPSNVLLDEDGVAHVGDFGLARMLLGNLSDAHFSSTLGLKGSIGYIAPEYGVGGAVSTRGDVYSYGMLLLEMFTRKKPIDEMFKEGLNMQKWVAMAFPSQLAEIIDPELVEEERDWGEDSVESIIRIGLSCTVEAQEERPNMREVYVMLKSVRDKALHVPMSHRTSNVR